MNVVTINMQSFIRSQPTPLTDSDLELIVGYGWRIVSAVWNVDASGWAPVLVVREHSLLAFTRAEPLSERERNMLKHWGLS